MGHIANNSHLLYADIDTDSYRDIHLLIRQALSKPIPSKPTLPPHPSELKPELKKEQKMQAYPAIDHSPHSGTLQLAGVQHSVIPDLKLNDLLNDEMTRMVMSRDAVNEQSLRQMLSLTANALRQRLA